MKPGCYKTQLDQMLKSLTAAAEATAATATEVFLAATAEVSLGAAAEVTAAAAAEAFLWSC
jgi:hypothetical protein